ncbi:SHOCT domain-containing protein [Gallionella capsiferriformans]|uniref:SHOCT domain-containing protein n=1 Tax=Gallionella capsiferriformans (strain ES-2) TaxID=395494 RepID=D9SG34_GALCS|nr:SHOCT domain-containing protein [Gallionella capsiferriformans]ADL55481.1 hypothetical protein Galf_1462 [Gallionella capsiferriformans ES-2]
MKLKPILSAALIVCGTYTPLASAGLFDSITSGIANAFDFSKQKLETYKQTTDKQLLDQFYYLSEDGKEEGLSKELAGKTKSFEFQKLTPSSLTVRQLMYREGNMQSVMQAMSRYTYSPMSDEYGQRYVAFAQSRGNVVKLYKPALGSLLNQMFAQNFYLRHDDRNTAEWIGVDNALVEYSPSGQIVSVMTRSHQATISIGVQSYQYINLYFGAGNAQIIENRIANQNFENNFIRVIASPSIPALVAQETKSPESANLTASSVRSGVAKIAPLTSTPSTPPATSPEQRMQMLKNLAELKQSGILTEQEFQAEKRKILAN